MSGVFEDILTYGPGGYDTTKPNNNIVSTVQKEVPLFLNNERQLRSKASAALTANATFLAIPTPTAAQVSAQTKLLTRQANGLIRIMLSRFEDISNT